MRQLIFTSEQFRPYLPEDCQVNPNVLGFELAEWLSRELAREGVVTSYPSFEDWGWYLERREGGAEYLICCSGGLEDGTYQWRVFVTRVKGLFQRESHDSRCHELLEHVKHVVDSSGVQTNWETDA